MKWRWVVGYRNYYKVSNTGKVKSVNRWVRHPKGGLKLLRGKILTQSTTNGYKVVTLSKEGKYKTKQVHLLVLEAFVGPCPPGMEACHFPDRDPTNNHVDNLRWDTHQANCQDQIKHGTTAKGKRNPRARLTDEDVLVIKTMRGMVPNQYLADLYQCTVSYLYLIWRGGVWNHVDHQKGL